MNLLNRLRTGGFSQVADLPARAAPPPNRRCCCEEYQEISCFSEERIIGALKERQTAAGSGGGAERSVRNQVTCFAGRGAGRPCPLARAVGPCQRARRRPAFWHLAASTNFPGSGSVPEAGAFHPATRCFQRLPFPRDRPRKRPMRKMMADRASYRHR